MATIAIVDDDEHYLEALKSYLESRGHVAWRSLDVNQFMAFVKDNKQKKPDLLILDMQMPGGGGQLAMKVIQADAELKKLPVIFSTSMPSEHVKGWFAELDQTKIRYMAKPPDFEVLDGYIKELLTGPR